jgi:hypothetical protein
MVYYKQQIILGGEEMKTFEELEYLDQNHLDFITAYLKHVLTYPQFGSLEKLYDIGAIVFTNSGERGIVVGYCGVGYEYVLFEDDSRDKGYYVTGVEYVPIKKVKKLAPLETIPLFLKMNDYLLSNQFKLSTAHQKVCYQHWLRTGEYEFNNPIGDTEKEKLEIQKKIIEKRKELEKLEEEFKSL